MRVNAGSDTSSDAASSLDDDDLTPSPHPDWPGDRVKENVNKLLADEVPQSSARMDEKPKVSEEDKAKAGPPTLAEWSDFFARLVLLTLAEWYVQWCFRGVPEEVISEDDLARCVLSKDERKAIALPMAELANKSALARKHGRKVIAFFESFESVILLGIWASKVHRIASKYRPRREKTPKQPKERRQRERMGQDETNPNGSGEGIVLPGVQVFNPGVG